MDSKIITKIRCLDRMEEIIIGLKFMVRRSVKDRDLKARLIRDIEKFESLLMTIGFVVERQSLLHVDKK